MTRREEIQIIDLLARRDAEFRTVNRCEETIKSLLGGIDYPYPPLPDLPSRRPRMPAKKAKPARKPAGALSAERPDWYRSLDGEREDVYRLEFSAIANGEIQTSFLLEGDMLQTLDMLRLMRGKLLRVETVKLVSAEEWQLVDTLFEQLEQ